MNLRTRTGALTLAVAALAGSAQVATAKTSTGTQPAASFASDCTAQTYSQALLGFGDSNLYAAVPQGSFEGAIDGWTITGAARQVADPAYPTGPVADTTSLELAAGATATSPPICANANTPTFRLFLKALSANPAVYGITVNYLDTTGGTVHGAAALTPSTTWGLSPQILVKTNKIATDSTGWGHIQISVTAPTNSALRIDDLYLDPKMR